MVTPISPIQIPQLGSTKTQQRPKKQLILLLAVIHIFLAYLIRLLLGFAFLLFIRGNSDSFSGFSGLSLRLALASINTLLSYILVIFAMGLIMRKINIIHPFKSSVIAGQIIGIVIFIISGLDYDWPSWIYMLLAIGISMASYMFSFYVATRGKRALTLALTGVFVCFMLLIFISFGV